MGEGTRQLHALAVGKRMKGFFCGPTSSPGHQPRTLASVQFCSQHESLSLVALRLSGALAMWGQQTPLCPSLPVLHRHRKQSWWCPLFQGACPSPRGSNGQDTGSLELGIWAGFLVATLASVSWCVICLPCGQCVRGGTVAQGKPECDE